MLTWLNKVSVFDDIYLCLILVATILLIYRYKTLTYNLKILPIFTFAHFTSEFVSLYVHYGLKVDNYPVYHAFAYVSYALLALFFYHTFRQLSLRKLTLVSIPFFWLLCIVYTLLWEPLDKYCSLAFMTEHFIMIIWCLLFFRELLTYSNYYQPEKDRSFWIVTSLLFYLGGNFFILGLYNYIEEHRRDILTVMYYVGYVFNYLLYITIILTCLIKFPADAHE